MTGKQYRELRNRLQSQACCVNVYSVEYRNINRRIAILTDKAHKADMASLAQQ